MPRDAAAARLVAHFAMRPLERAIARAIAARDRASAARRDLSPGSSRARVTKANARWSTMCEEVDRLTAARAEALRMIADRGAVLRVVTGQGHGAEVRVQVPRAVPQKAALAPDVGLVPVEVIPMPDPRPRPRHDPRGAA